MKKIAFYALLTMCAAASFAGGIDNKTNMSTGYHRNPSRNTESKRPEAVFYNEAGTGFMTDGLYIEAGNQFVFKEYSDTLDGTTYTDDKNVYFYPNADIVYKNGKFAVFGGFGIYGGGGELDYTDGTAATYELLYAKSYQYAYTAYTAKGADSTTAAAAAKTAAASVAGNHSLNVYSVTFGEVLGASYQINDMISVSAAGRLLEGHQKLSLIDSASLFSQVNGSDEVSYEARGIGFGGIFGVHVKPIASLDLTAQYQTITKLSMKFDSLGGTMASTILGAEEGDTFDNDMPAVLNIGAGYQICEPVYVSMSFNYYFNEQAKIDNVVNQCSEYDYDNSWEAGAGIDWTVNNKILVSTGALYSKQGTTSTSNNVFSPVLDSVTIGAGAEYKAYKDILTLSAGVLYSKYFEETYQGLDLNKKIVLFSLGATYKPF